MQEASRRGEAVHHSRRATNLDCSSETIHANGEEARPTGQVQRATAAITLYE